MGRVSGRNTPSKLTANGLKQEGEIKAGDKIKCKTSVGYYKLTEGKVYECLYGLEEGIFEDRPFVTVIGDNGKKVAAHASRFEVVEEEK